MTFRRYLMALGIAFSSLLGAFGQEPANKQVAEKQSNSNSDAELNLTDLDSIQNEIRKLLASKSVAESKITEFDWTTRTNLHSRLIVLLSEMEHVAELLVSARRDLQDRQSVQEWHSLNANIQLELAMILVKKDQHDLALGLLEQLDTSRLVDPGLALLYRTICLHKLVKVDAALNACTALMKHRKSLPMRYQQLTESLYNDLSRQKEEPLHSVVRLMSDVKRRQNLEQHSEKVLKQEKEIVRKLDEIIKSLEQQKKKSLAAAESQSKPSSSDPKSGQSNSTPASSGQQGSGDVNSKTQDSDGNWGSLSAEQRAIAVKALVRELPPHFQALMKAYFQKLAEEKK